MWLMGDRWGRSRIFMSLDEREYTQKMGKRLPEVSTHVAYWQVIGGGIMLTARGRGLRCAIVDDLIR